MDASQPPAEGRNWWRIGGRIFMLLLGGLSLYLLAPKVLLGFSLRGRSSRRWSPAWPGLAIAFESMSYVSLWAMHVLRFTRPAGLPLAPLSWRAERSEASCPEVQRPRELSATRMLTRAGIRAADVASGSGGWPRSRVQRPSSPRLFRIAWDHRRYGGAGRPAPDRLRRVAGFVAMAVLAATAFGWDGPLLVVGRTARWVIRRFRRDRAADLPEHLLAQRDRMKQTFGRRWLLR